MIYSCYDVYVGVVYVSKFHLRITGLVELCDEVAASACAQAAVSNACGEYVRAVLATNQVSNGFSIQLGADEVPAPKPAPDGLLMCCEALGLEPSQVLRCVHASPKAVDSFREGILVCMVCIQLTPQPAKVSFPLMPLSATKALVNSPSPGF